MIYWLYQIAKEGFGGSPLIDFLKTRKLPQKTSVEDMLTNSVIKYYFS